MGFIEVFRDKKISLLLFFSVAFLAFSWGGGSQ